MRRALLLAVVGAVLVVAFAGVALAQIMCTGGTCTGTPGDDTIIGSAQRDVIFALAGNDRVEARAGDDELNGDQGNDTLFGEAGNDLYFGNRGDDTLADPDADITNDEMFGGQ